MKVPYDTKLKITETQHDGFDVYEAYEITNADEESDNKSVVKTDNGAEITVKGDVSLKFVNTRSNQKVRVLKTDIDGETPLKGAIFTISIGDTKYTFTSDDDGYLKNEDFREGIITVPFGIYTLTESTPPPGYMGIDSGIEVRVDKEGIHAQSYEVKKPTKDEDYYTIVVPNNPGVELPMTGGTGGKWMYLWGTFLIVISGLSLLVTRRFNKVI